MWFVEDGQGREGNEGGRAGAGPGGMEAAGRGPYGWLYVGTAFIYHIYMRGGDPSEAGAGVRLHKWDVG